MYQGLKGSKVVIKQRDNLMERQITILEQSKYEDFKAICDDEGNGISNFEADQAAKRDPLTTSSDGPSRTNLGLIYRPKYLMKDKSLCRSNKLFGNEADCIADGQVEFGGSKFSIFENAFGKTGICAPHAGEIIR